MNSVVPGAAVVGTVVISGVVGTVVVISAVARKLDHLDF